MKYSILEIIPEDFSRALGEDLIQAVKLGCACQVKKLLLLKADSNVQDEQGNTALHWAIKNGHDRLIRLLISHKVELNLQDDYGDTPLILLAQQKYNGQLLKLIQAGAKLDVQNNSGKTALMLAACYGRAVLKRTALTGAQAENEAICVVSEYGDEKSVKVLLDAGADVNIQDNFGETALMWVSKKGDFSIAKILLEGFADYNMKNNEGYNALMIAVIHNQIVFIQELLAYCDIEIEGPENDAESAMSLVHEQAKLYNTDALVAVFTAALQKRSTCPVLK